MNAPQLRRLGVDDLYLVGQIDRSEHVEIEYTVRRKQLVERPASMKQIPPWDPVGTGQYSVAAEIAFCDPLVRGGASFFGAFEGDALLGLAIVDPTFDASMAWLAFLHISRPYRRRGAATALWNAAEEEARAAGATSMYVSAVPTGSAVGFYLSRGCELAESVHPDLYAMEPDDVHLVCPLSRSVD